MNKLFFSSIILILGLTACSNSSCSTAEENEGNEEISMELGGQEEVLANASVVLDIEGMVCEMGCVSAIENGLNTALGVASCTVDYENGTATVSYDNEQTNSDELIAVVSEIGSGQYSAALHQE